jgi:hypothetical protein
MSRLEPWGRGLVRAGGCLLMGAFVAGLPLLVADEDAVAFPTRAPPSASLAAANTLVVGTARFGQEARAARVAEAGPSSVVAEAAWDASARAAPDDPTKVERPLEDSPAVPANSDAGEELGATAAPLATLVVRAFEVGTGLPAALAELSWYVPSEDPAAGATLTAVEAGEPGVFRFEAPVGPLVLEVLSEGYRRETTRLEVLPGEQELALDLTPALGVELRVAGPGGGLAGVAWQVELIAAGEEAPRVRLEGLGGGSFFLPVGAPGRFRLEVVAPAGFRPLAAREVVVGQEVLSHALELRRTAG